MSDRLIDPNAAVDHILRNAGKFSAAKAHRTYLEEFRKSKKALLMKASGVEAIGAQEREAYAHAEYIGVLEGIREAVEIEEKLKWELEAARLRVEIWRTESANNRNQDRATQ